MKNVAVFGLGRFGRSVATELMKSGASVMVVDSDEELIDKYGTKCTYAQLADLRSADSIRALGISNMDAVVVAMAESLEPSIMSIMTAKELGVPLVIAKALDKSTAEIFRKVGADKIVFPEEESGISTAHKVLSSDFVQFFDLDELAIVEMNPKSNWIGKNLIDLNLRKKYGINVVAMYVNGKMSAVTDPKKPIAKDNKMLVLVEKKDIKKIEKE